MKGIYIIPDGLDESAQSMLNNLQSLAPIKIIKQPKHIACELYKYGWSKLKGKTSSSPSGLHIGHWE